MRHYTSTLESGARCGRKPELIRAVIREGFQMMKTMSLIDLDDPTLAFAKFYLYRTVELLAEFLGSYCPSVHG